MFEVLEHHIEKSNVAMGKRTTERLAIDKNLLAENIKKGKRLPPDQLISSVMTVTPELAKFILERYNTRNRPITESKVKEYTDTMKEGRWSFTSQGISFARSGVLNNGQHRLMAIVRSGQSVRMYLTFGEDVKAFEVLDTARARTGSDALSILGRKNTHTLAAAARLVHTIETKTFHRPVSLGNDEVIGLVELYNGLDEAVVTGHRLGANFKISGSVLSTAIYLIQRESKHRNQLAEFVQTLEKGMGFHSERDPVLKLRERLYKKKLGQDVRSNVVRGVIIVACVIKAWNAFVKGRTVKLAWDTTEQFPGVI